MSGGEDVDADRYIPSMRGSGVDDIGETAHLARAKDARA
jgi:hypothetical protein